jgi:hypothetical protein
MADATKYLTVQTTVHCKQILNLRKLTDAGTAAAREHRAGGPANFAAQSGPLAKIALPHTVG